MWLTLLALLFGERLLGIPGIILAPVVLSFIKVQASKFEVQTRSNHPDACRFELSARFVDGMGCRVGG